MKSLSSDLVRVRFYAAARAAVGTAELEVAPDNAGKILRNISELNPQAARVFSHCSVLINGEICHDLSLHIAGGSEMDVLPPFAGGAA